ncbi:MAG: MBOAT family protein [Blautia sp.]|nr:MBOAT family protein [Blautia sp.]
MVFITGSYFLTCFVAHRIRSVYRLWEQESQSLSSKEKRLGFSQCKKKVFPLLLVGIILILGSLILTKAVRLAGGSAVKLIVPLGLSYYTLSCTGYLLDIYWGKIKTDPDPFGLLICITYFPIIVQGPISRYEKLLKQFENPPGFDYSRVCFGLQRMLWGLIKKSVISDRISLYTTSVFSHLSENAGLEILLAVLGNVAQLYTDFSGCMDIVIGASQVIGISLDENFREPFLALSSQEFWRRWHITLGQWFRDYVYMPIAMHPGHMKRVAAVRKKFGSRAGQAAASAVPILTVWILTGLWHGTGWGYLAWGIYWGLLILLETVFPESFLRFFKRIGFDTDSKGFHWLLRLRTLICFSIGRMLTALGSPWGLFRILGRLFHQARLNVLFNGSLFSHGLDGKDFLLVLAGLFLVFFTDLFHDIKHTDLRTALARKPLPIRWVIYFGGIILLILTGIYGSNYDPGSFIYGGF